MLLLEQLQRLQGPQQQGLRREERRQLVQ